MPVSWGTGRAPCNRTLVVVEVWPSLLDRRDAGIEHAPVFLSLLLPLICDYGQLTLRLLPFRLRLVDLRVLVHPDATGDWPLDLLSQVVIRPPVGDGPRIALAHG